MKGYTTVITALVIAIATLSTDNLKHFANLGFSGLKGVTKVSYTLTYYSNGRQKGVVGGFKVNPTTTRSVRRQILGTCSSGKCVYHNKPTNFELQTTFYLKNGKPITQTKTLP